MSQSFEPFYDVNRTYDDNYAQGPFGAFAQALADPARVDNQSATSSCESFLGFPVNLPFGIPAGPLLNERFTTAAFRMGFDLAVYKNRTVAGMGCTRSRTYSPCIPGPPTAF